MSGNVKKFRKNKGYESINRNMLQDEENLSLTAIGLLANLTSYPDGWTVYKTELYKRFAKSGRRVVERAWNELIENKYIVQLKKRNGKKYEYIYYHSQVPFTEDDIREIEKAEGVPIWDGKISKPCNDSVSSTVQNEQSKENSNCTVQNEQYKMNSTKRTHNKLTNKKINHKDKDLDTIDTRNFNQEVSEQERLERKNYYMQKAFYENTEKIPAKIADMLRVFSESTEQAKKYYNIILTAKNNVEKETNNVIWLENEPELQQEIINTFSRSIKKIEKERNIENKEGYLYSGIYNFLAEKISHQSRNKKLNEIMDDPDSIYNVNL